MSRRALFLTPFAVVLFASTALAAPTIREQLPPAAQRPWDNAMQLLRAKDCRGAIPEFTRAYDLSKNPRVLYNLAICEKELGHYVRAAARFEQELAEGEGKISADEKAELQNAIRIVRAFVTTVVVRSNEAGATLFIDDYEVGKTPFLQPVPIDVGAGRVLKLVKDGFQEQTRTLDLTVGKEASVTFSLQPVTRKSLVNVTATGAPNATITMDGVEMGPSPFKGQVLVGRHTFEARATGYEPARQTSEVVFGESLNLVLSMSVARHEAKVRIDAEPSGAVIQIDDRVVGADHWEGVLTSGGHQVFVKKPGYQTATQELALTDDQVRHVKISLVQERGTAWVWWTAGGLAVLGGVAALSYFVFKPAEASPYVGTFNPGTTTARFRF